MGHNHPVGWRPREIATFFNSIFKDGILLAKITGIEKRNAVIKFDFESMVALKNANFYYTNDTLNINANRMWNSFQ
ncbi:hypothetical protein GCM10007383_25350 [Arenibacter certesii]|uniref:Uncharacterized protein n=1 Tax=Arenibacter certesii TaxID=228955 RepID=A0A918J2A1_9FLAO|nr:hypothetical protein GCM10007383_25350 [Arenibacter certesii]